MKTYRDECLVLRTHKLGEADRIITLLSRHHGQIRAVAKGVRRTSSRFGARLEPFGLVDAQFHRGRNLDVITQVETITPYGREIGTDYELFTTASVMAETAQRLTADETEVTQQYLLLLGAIHALATRRHAPELVLGSYLLRALAVAGWAPSCFDCAHCGAPGPHQGFNIPAGGAVCEDCAPPGTPAVPVATMELMGALLSGNWWATQDVAQATKRRASGIINSYTQWHLEQRLRSLAVLEHRG